jgi:hypothetical protein
MKQEIAVFNGNEISFSFEREKSMMVNATEMAKIFGKDVSEFTRNTGTENFIKALSQTENCRFENEFSPDGVFVKIIKGGRNSGTWMDKRVALKFAAWLDPFFEVWVYSTIETLLFGKHLKREQSFERTIKLQNEMEDIIHKPQKNNEDFDRFIQIQKELKMEVALRKSLTIEGLSGMKSLF